MMKVATVFTMVTVLISAASLNEKREISLEALDHVRLGVEHALKHAFSRRDLHQPDKRFISLHDIENGLHHLGHAIEDGVHHIGHEIEHGVEHLGHEIEHGVQHLGHELEHITGIHNAKDVACKIYSYVKHVTGGELGCDAKCIAIVTPWAPLALPLCPEACHKVFHEADELDC